jgi:YVTN family beta-propeller protein
MRRGSLVAALLLLLCVSARAPRCDFHERAGHALFASPQVAPLALSADGRRLYVANTTSNTVGVIDTTGRREVEEIAVGLEPVSLALRPDGGELFVSNHVSDSVDVIDTDPASPMRHRVVATLQDLDARGATRFDEPVGIAFASNDKAYVALSSRDEIAVLRRDAEGRWRVQPERIRIAAQDPRAIAVRGGRLYVLPFESSNQTELSNCVRGDDPPQCTFGVLDPPRAPGDPLPKIHIVRDPDVPDRDLFVYDTADDHLASVVSHVGTLLYGLAVSREGRVFVAHTEARNDANGLQGGKLADLDNRTYLNRIAEIDCGGADCRFDAASDLIALEPAPPAQPAEGRQLATPYALALSDDETTLVATAAASDRIFTLDTATGAVQGVLDVGAGPRGLALRSNARTGRPEVAYVLDAFDDTVLEIDVSRPQRLRVIATIPVGRDPTPDAVRRGRIAFESARASSSGTFACASCHPDAHVDQLLWRIGGACTTSPDCTDVPRSTQPIRGLRHTVPLHWDGTLGDPFGGPNGAVGVGGDGGVDCNALDADGEHDCFLDLVRTSLSAVMCDQHGPCPPGGTRLSPAEQDDLAEFLASVWHPPARSRPLDDHVSPSALQGFSDFYVDHGGLDRGTCASGGCHELPLGVGTNGTNPNLSAFDAPSLRGLTDRVVQGSLGGNFSEEGLLFMNAPHDLLFPLQLTPPSEFPYDPAVGKQENSVFAVGFLFFRLTIGVGPVDIFQMVEEASTGTSGATGRQVTLDAATLAPPDGDATGALLSQLEAADRRGVVQLSGEATRLRGARGLSLAIRYIAARDSYRLGVEEIPRNALLTAARSGALRATLTAGLPPHFDDGIHRQPLISPLTPGEGPTGDPALPVLPGENPMQLRATDVAAEASLFLDGAATAGEVTCLDGAFAPTYCSSGRVAIRLATPPTAPGIHLLQVQNPDGPQSNELPICVEPLEACL